MICNCGFGKKHSSQLFPSTHYTDEPVLLYSLQPPYFDGLTTLVLLCMQFLQRVFGIDTMVKPLPPAMAYNVSYHLNFFTQFSFSNNLVLSQNLELWYYCIIISISCEASEPFSIAFGSIKTLISLELTSSMGLTPITL